MAKKTPKLNIYLRPERELNPVVKVGPLAAADTILIDADTVKLLNMKKGDRLEFANQRNNKKKWLVRKGKKGHPVLESGFLEGAENLARTMLSCFGSAKQLTGTVELTEKFNGWYAINFLPIEI